MGIEINVAHSTVVYVVGLYPGPMLSFTPPSQKVNIRAKQRASFKQVSEKKTPVREEKQSLGSVYHDPRMAPVSAQRSRKQFKFNEPGKCMSL